MPFEDLMHFIERDMRMSHVYQPVMLRALLDRSGRASVQDVARALLNEDRSQLEYYFEITRNMVGRVLTNRAVVKRQGEEYELLGYDKLTPDQVQNLGPLATESLMNISLGAVMRFGSTGGEAPAISAVPCAMKSLRTPSFVASFVAFLLTSALWKWTT
jgi:hypothetical protein